MYQTCKALCKLAFGIKGMLSALGLGTRLWLWCFPHQKHCLRFVILSWFVRGFLFLCVCCLNTCGYVYQASTSLPKCGNTAVSGPTQVKYNIAIELAIACISYTQLATRLACHMCGCQNAVVVTVEGQKDFFHLCTWESAQFERSNGLKVYG